MKTLDVAVEFIEELLGTANADPNIHKRFIADNAGTEEKANEEVESVEKATNPDEEFEKSITVFPRDKDGKLCVYDYQWKGLLKDAVGMLRKVKSSEASKMKAYKKEIDGLIFPQPRMIPIEFEGEIGICQRPLRAQTMQGERVALASSECIPAGAKMHFQIMLLCDEHEGVVREALEYGQLRGFGQWRNSGKGRFRCTVTDITGEAKAAS